MTLTESSDFDIRYTTEEDIESLRAWMASPEMLHWYPPSPGDELENFIRIWIGFSRYGASLTALYKDQPIGLFTLYLMPYKKVAHHCIFQMIIDSKHQRQGVGRSLVRNGMHHAKQQFRLEMLQAEIIDHSPIVPLLKSMGFELVTVQEGYVKEEGNYFPRILMEASL
ncbi:MAG: hypothetical protein KR126chlam1_00192 [Chlamydiae bacterium]|nr:hypothetical protein [Chlamydiota bacterium]